ncbi:MAG: 16S rRNA processing protein RimM [Erysipelotrichales bacterium]|nr:16S rRNA processing protein RimM [Erysipelotrichales bacterium]
MDFVFLGKIVNTHGIKGEFRIKSDFERKDLVFKIGGLIYIDSTPYEITSYRVHKGYDMVTIKGFNDINQVLPFKGKNVFIDRNSLNLSNEEYILEDLIGCEVILGDFILGKVIDYAPGVNALIEVDYNKKKYYIPIKGNFIRCVDKDNKKIYVTEETKGLIL